MKTHWNPSGIAIVFLGLIAGYSFGGSTGLGIASIILIVIQLVGK